MYDAVRTKTAGGGVEETNKWRGEMIMMMMLRRQKKRERGDGEKEAIGRRGGKME